jgi:hypothetical protein
VERPNTILGLSQHIVRERWRQLSTRGRVLVIGGGLLISLAGVQGARMAMGDCACAHSCASMHAAAD